MAEECDGWEASLQTSLEIPSTMAYRHCRCTEGGYNIQCSPSIIRCEVWCSAACTHDRIAFSQHSASMRQLLSLCSYRSRGNCGSERASNLPQVTQLAGGRPEIWTQAHVSPAAWSMPCWFAPRAHWGHASVLGHSVTSDSLWAHGL